MEKYQEKLEFPLKDYKIKYDNDEIVRYSVIRGITNLLSKEFCGNLNNISKIEIREDKSNNRNFLLIVYSRKATHGPVFSTKKENES